MKKFSFLFLLGFLVSASSALAQLAINPNPVYVNDILADDFEGIGHSLVENNTGGNANLTWQRTVIEETEGWTSAICDVTQCYLPTVSSQAFGLAAGESGTMDVHVYPNGIDGGSIIQVDVFKTNDPSVSTSATYYFNQLVGVTEKFSEAIKVYPNPTQDWISVDNSDNVVTTASLYNVAGQLVQSSSVNGNQRISIQELSAGNYVLKLMDANAHIVSTNHLVKQ